VPEWLASNGFDVAEGPAARGLGVVSRRLETAGPVEPGEHPIVVPQIKLMKNATLTNINGRAMKHLQACCAEARRRHTRR
jgi:hypothetical protein